MTIGESLRTAVISLKDHSDSPRLDAELLLGEVLGLPRSDLRMRRDDALGGSMHARYEALIAQRRHGMPVAYLTGVREFWSLPLSVTPDVLVPRPETELLVERALELLPPSEPRSVLDAGTGSGAIALAIASERPLAEVVGTDISAPALAVAARNGARLSLPRIEWRQGSWFDAVPGDRFHLIVSNPPYVACGDPALASLAAEPVLALRSGPSGLDALAKIIAGAAPHLNEKGWLLLEHGSTQADAVARLLEQEGFRSIRTHIDYSGNPRVTLGTLH